jgi:hypothetical protein
MSPSKLIPSLLVATLAVGFMAPRAEAQANGLANGLVINKVDLTNFQIVDNVLKAAGKVSGTLAGRPFTTDITNFALQLAPDDAAPTDCSVLNLQLAPIHLTLLGLHADTSAICLDITATPSPDGGLLGDLLCSLAGGGGILGGLAAPVLPTADDVTDLSGGLLDVLNGALGDLLPGGDGNDSVCTGDCHVLELALGPVDLSLLGLNVSLDDCDNGPVQVCVSATAAEGLLGGLLCGLTGNGGILGNLGVLQQLLDTLNGALGGLLDGAPGAANLTAKQSTQLINRLSDQLVGRVADGVLSPKELAKVTKTVKQVLNK